jgi:putative endonuclease
MYSGNYYVYITTNPAKRVPYTCITNNLQRRIMEHYNNRGNSKTFAGNYYCYMLIYYECYEDIGQAIAREKKIKSMSRTKKEDLIAAKTPKWSFISV